MATRCTLACLLPAVLLAPTTGSLAATAADAAPEPTTEELVVTGSRIPTPADDLAGAPYRFDAAELELAGATFAADLVGLLPGTAINRAGGLGAQTQLRLRGAEANQTLVLLDGYQLNDPAIGNEFNFAHLLGGSIDGIEMLSGQRSALWGSEAGAGVINLVPPAAGADRSLALNAATGSFDSRRFDLEAGLRSERGEAALRISDLSSDGVNASRSGSEQDGYENSSVALHGATELGDAFGLGATLYHVEARSDVDDFPFNVPVDADLQLRTRQTLLGARLQYAPDGGRHRQHLAVQWFSSRHRDLDAGVRTASREGERLRVDWTGSLELEHPALDAQRITLVLEAERESFQQRGAPGPFGDPNQDQEIDQRSAVLEYRVALDAWRLAAIGRFDHNDAFDDALTWRAEARRATAIGDLWLGGGRSIQNPSFIERFGFTPDTFTGNPDIQPEEILGWELGWQRELPAAGLRLSAVWHHARLRDEIDGFAFDPGLGGFTAVNRPGTSRREGLELTLAWQLRPGTDLRLSWSGLDASQPDGNGGQVEEIRRPRQGASAVLASRLFDDRLGLWLDANWRGEMSDNDFATFPATTVTLEERLLVDARIAWRASDGITLFLRGDNLFDTGYEDVFGFGDQGRSLMAGIRLTMGR